jgi:hypothetical protein
MTYNKSGLLFFFVKRAGGSIMVFALMRQRMKVVLLSSFPWPLWVHCYTLAGQVSLVAGAVPSMRLSGTVNGTRIPMQIFIKFTIKYCTAAEMYGQPITGQMVGKYSTMPWISWSISSF